MSADSGSCSAILTDPSLADVLVAVQNAPMPARRRQEMASALRTVSRVLDKPLERIPASPQVLAKLLGQVAPCGMSQTRRNNVRSLIRAAVALVRPVSPGRLRSPLSPAWKALRDQLRSASLRLSLSRLLHFCSSGDIDPDKLCIEVFEAFHQFLSDSLTTDSEKIYVRTMKAWRAAQGEVPDWPQLAVEVPDRRKNWTLPWKSFAPSFSQDFGVWRDRLAGLDILDEGPSRPLRRRSVEHREWQVRAFASALVRRGRDPATIRSLGDLVELETFREGMRYLLERTGNKPTSGTGGVAAGLMAIARHHVRLEPAKLDSLARVARRVSPGRRGLTPKNRARLRQFDDVDNARALVDLPPLLIRLAARNPDRRRGAVQAQLAAAIEIELMAPMRIGNLANLDLEIHLVKPGRGPAVHIVVEDEEVKNREFLDFPLPAESVQLLEAYQHQFRPVLATPSSTALFPGRGGKPKNQQGFGRQISQTIWQYTGLRVHPHLIRHTVAKIYLDANPGAYGVVQRVLGHKTPDTTMLNYTGAEIAAAIRHFDETILRLRHHDPASPPKPRAPMQADRRLARSRPRSLERSPSPR
jgi:integrase